LQTFINTTYALATASIGVGELSGATDDVDSILERIDKAAFRAKAQERDRIEVCTKEEATGLQV
jgi:PleD family two-component response regulator